MFVINHKKIFVTLSAILMTLGLISVAVFGLDLSIEFTGGSIVEVEYAEGERPDKQTVNLNLSNGGVSSFTLQPVEDNRYALRTQFLTEAETENIREIFASGGGEIIRESAIGPSVGKELRTKAILAIIVVSAAIIAFIAFAFRKVSWPIKSWKYGLVAIIALVHDIIIPTGVFAVLGYLLGFEVDLLFVMGLLVILGYSVNDTIVVFDRVRENLLLEQLEKQKNKHLQSKSFAEIVGVSLEQTYARSLNTSLTTLVVLICLYIFGGESTNHFALMLIVGIISGAYSSIFLASPMLVYLAKDVSIFAPEGKEAIERASLSKEERRAQLSDPGLE